jgi:hypothetical protein
MHAHQALGGVAAQHTEIAEIQFLAGQDTETQFVGGVEQAETRALAAAAAAGYDDLGVRAREGCEQARQVFRPVLAIGVHDGDQIRIGGAQRIIQPYGNGALVSDIPREPDDRVDRRRLGHTGSIVHGDDGRGDACLVQDRLQLFDQDMQTRPIIVHGRHDHQLRCHAPDLARESIRQGCLSFSNKYAEILGAGPAVRTYPVHPA